MFNWRLFSRKTHLWNIAEWKRQEEDDDQDYDEQEYDEAADEDNQADDEEIIDIDDQYTDELSSISSGDDTDESDWFDADDWADAPLRQQPPPPPQSWAYYEMQLSFIKFTITQQKLTLAKLHGMRFNPLTNNICRNRHR
jgi:hypothetical protein